MSKYFRQIFSIKRLKPKIVIIKISCKTIPIKTGCDQFHFLVDVIVQSWTIPSSTSELKLAFFYGSSCTQSNRIHERWIAFAEIDLEQKCQVLKCAVSSKTFQLLWGSSSVALLKAIFFNESIKFKNLHTSALLFLAVR